MVLRDAYSERVTSLAAPPDTIVAPEVTKQYAEGLCSQGESVDFRLYPGIGHLDGGVHAAPDVATWIADRFADKPATSTCG